MKTVHATRKERVDVLSYPLRRFRGRMTRRQRQRMLAMHYGFRARWRRDGSFEPSWDAYPSGDNR